MTDDPPTTKAELMRRQREGGERWEALLARVPPERRAEPGVKGERSVKDIHYLDFADHLSAWLAKGGGGG